MNKLDPWYQSLLSLLVSEDQSFSKSDRTGTGTKSLFGVQFRHDMSDGFPLLTTKKMAWKVMVTELLWFLKGDTNIKYLVDNGCHIWDGDAYKNYLFTSEWLPISGVGGGFIGTKANSDEIMTQDLFINKIKTDDEFAAQWGELGPIYGKQWRNWDVPKVLTMQKGKVENGIGTEWGSWERNPIDQIANLINELKTNPDSRRMLVSAWNCSDLDSMILPPCHYGFQMYTRELSKDERIQIYINQYMGGIGKPGGFEDAKLSTRNIPTRAISLMWNQRSVDTFLGLPFNIASYGLLLMMIADEVNMVPDQLIGNLGDVHLYKDHIEQAKEQIGRTPYELPTVHVRDGIESSMPNDIILQNYQSHPSIKAPLSN